MFQLVSEFPRFPERIIVKCIHICQYSVELIVYKPSSLTTSISGCSSNAVVFSSLAVVLLVYQVLEYWCMELYIAGGIAGVN